MGDLIGKIFKLGLLSTLSGSVGALAAQVDARAAASPAAPDVFSLYASAGQTHDSNLFRLPGGVDPTPLVGKADRSDDIRTVNAGFRIEKPFSQQRFKLDASVTESTYGNHGFLDHDTYQYDGAWYWHLTPRISGVLGVSRTEALVGFDNLNAYDQKIRVTTEKRFEANFWLASNWHALAGFLLTKQTTSRSFQQESDFDLHGWNAGVRYDRGAGRTLEFRYFERDGKFIDRRVDPVAYIDDAFKQRDYEARLAYAVSDRTRIEGTVAFVDRSHPHIPQRDFDGWRGKAGLSWMATGKIAIRADYERRIQSWEDVDSSYYVSDTVTVGPQWSVTAKQALSASAVLGKTRYEGAPPTWTGPLREDKRRALAFNWAWEPHRAVSVNATVRREIRDSNLDNHDFADTTVGLNLRLLF